MRNQVLQYQTELSPERCIQKITSLPWTYCQEYFDELWYKCENVSDNNLILTFTGGRFRKIMRTQYHVSFSVLNEYTTVTLKFIHEMLGLPPMTPVRDIDCFMKTKIGAFRK